MSKIEALEAEVFAPISEAVRFGEERAMREAGMHLSLVRCLSVQVPPARYRKATELPDEAVVVESFEMRWVEGGESQ